VIIDSPVGPHHGADVSAPVFQRIAQQVLEYLHTSHDIELPPNRQVLLAARHVNKQDEEEGSQDHLGEPLEVAENGSLQDAPLQSTGSATGPGVVPAALREPVATDGANVGGLKNESNSKEPTIPGQSQSSIPTQVSTGGTVVVDIEQAGIVVPSFIGKSVRAAVETAEEAGLDLDAVGSGLAHEQQPPPGSHVAAGTRVMVRFGR